jgi:hypothetical protein
LCAQRWHTVSSKQCIRIKIFVSAHMIYNLLSLGPGGGAGMSSSSTPSAGSVCSAFVTATLLIACTSVCCVGSGFSHSSGCTFGS